MWGHMAGMGNVGDWCDSGASLPCELMDSLDDMSTAAAAPTPGNGDLDFLCQMGGTRYGDWTSVTEGMEIGSVPLSPPASYSIPQQPPSSASTASLQQGGSIKMEGEQDASKQPPPGPPPLSRAVAAAETNPPSSAAAAPAQVPRSLRVKSMQAAGADGGAANHASTEAVLSRATKRKVRKP
eukprot:Tamp_18213.p1 GENE.Tamp_18213~~Tamp_18213.p1  ORF type:complete len:182 (+),score=26.44 Tamp_18213:481-1026(+)